MFGASGGECLFQRKRSDGLREMQALGLSCGISRRRAASRAVSWAPKFRTARSLKLERWRSALSPEKQTEQQNELMSKERGAGRKPKEESRATELRQAVVAWNEIPK